MIMRSTVGALSSLIPQPSFPARGSVLSPRTPNLHQTGGPA